MIELYLSAWLLKNNDFLVTSPTSVHNSLKQFPPLLRIPALIWGRCIINSRPPVWVHSSAAFAGRTHFLFTVFYCQGFESEKERQEEEIHQLGNGESCRDCWRCSTDMSHSTENRRRYSFTLIRACLSLLSACLRLQGDAAVFQSGVRIHLCRLHQRRVRTPSLMFHHCLRSTILSPLFAAF